MRHYYARQLPRGFVNEVDIHVFTSRTTRNEWVDAHRNDGDVNSATMGAVGCSLDQAREWAALNHARVLAHDRADEGQTILGLQALMAPGLD